MVDKYLGRYSVVRSNSIPDSLSERCAHVSSIRCRVVEDQALTKGQVGIRAVSMSERMTTTRVLR